MKVLRYILLVVFLMAATAHGQQKLNRLLVTTNTTESAGSVTNGDAQFDFGVTIGGVRRTTWPTTPPGATVVTNVVNSPTGVWTNPSPGAWEYINTQQLVHAVSGPGWTTDTNGFATFSTNGWTFGSANALTNGTGSNGAVVTVTNGTFNVAISPSLTNTLVTLTLWNLTNASLQAAIATAQSTATSALGQTNGFASIVYSNASLFYPASNPNSYAPTNGLVGLTLWGQSNATLQAGINSALGQTNGFTSIVYSNPSAFYPATGNPNNYASPRYRLGLTPGGAEITGASTDPLLVGVAGVSNNWSELEYNDTVTNRTWFIVPASWSYSGGALTNHLLWYAQSATNGNVVWFIRYRSIGTNGVFDSAEPAAHMLTNGVSAGISNVVDGLLIFTPTSAELSNGMNTAVQIGRDAPNAADTAVSNANLVGFNANE